MPTRDDESATAIAVIDPLVGSIFDKRFRIDEKIAAGGFGAIYRATHVKSGHQIALKVLLPTLAQDLGIVARFRREGDTMTALRSPHTITAYELGQAPDRTLFIVMELLHGKSLFDHYEQHGGPFYLGYMHWRLHPHLAEGCGVVLGPRADALAVGFRNGTDHVVQYGFVRQTSHFSSRELAIFELIGPLLQRLARERPTPSLPASLTISERRILCDVAAGLSNSEIAEDSCIAVSTVRKHLENVYRKLGVTNRMAAIARLRGSDEPGLDLQERVDRFA